MKLFTVILLFTTYVKFSKIEGSASPFLEKVETAFRRIPPQRVLGESNE